jgi:hypothetical protein
MIMTQDGSQTPDAPDRLGAKLQSLYETLPADEQQVLDFLLRQAAERVAEQAEVSGYSLRAAPELAQPGAGTQDAMKRVLFGAAGVTGGLATPGVINWLVASARDANLFS